MKVHHHRSSWESFQNVVLNAVGVESLVVLRVIAICTVKNVFEIHENLGVQSKVIRTNADVLAKIRAIFWQLEWAELLSLSAAHFLRDSCIALVSMAVSGLALVWSLLVWYWTYCRMALVFSLSERSEKVPWTIFFPEWRVAELPLKKLKRVLHWTKNFWGKFPFATHSNWRISWGSTLVIL